ncbi:uncharacterized protein NPIL_62171 [Nephila pilipes]|uniref:Uncharacterized protein n=1 Tax=Nephila pilipes TaxID=299642 RepID=A0A8X6QIB5_NEPPI|nr:uncharacterized protein NPIL_62171 [Nephila pilipes]
MDECCMRSGATSATLCTPESNIVRQNVYLDDILSGCSNLKELEILKSELVLLFESVGISLHSWCFSHSNSDLPDFQFDKLCEENTVKTLGVLWNSSSDTFGFKAHIDKNLLTKRDVLFQIACLIDPLGPLGSVISKVKFFTPSLWLLKIDWHEKLPRCSCQSMVYFLAILTCLERVKVPRFVLLEILLHGFVDASENEFGAVIYISVRTINGDKN